jgi:hypothetical protein
MSPSSSSEPITTLNIRCLCRANDFTISSPTSQLPLSAKVCHCDSCRHLTGGLYSSGVVWPEGCSPNPTSLDTGSKSPSHAATSVSFGTLGCYSYESVNWHFCTTCGSPMPALPHKKELGPFCAETGVIQGVTSSLVRYSTETFVGDTKDGGASPWIRALPGLAGAGAKGEENWGTLTSWRGVEGSSEKLPQGWPHTGTSSESPASPTDDRIQGSCKCGGVSFYLERPTSASLDPSLDLRTPEQRPPPHGPESAWWIAGENKDKYLTGLCVCESCRLASGVDFVSWAFVPRCNMFTSSGEAWSPDFGTLKSYKSSENATWLFCGKCGTTCFLICETQRPQVIDVAAGCLWSYKGARAENWLEWKKSDISFLEEGEGRPLVEGLCRGLGTRSSRYN